MHVEKPGANAPIPPAGLLALFQASPDKDAAQMMFDKAIAAVLVRDASHRGKVLLPSAAHSWTRKSGSSGSDARLVMAEIVMAEIRASTLSRVACTHCPNNKPSLLAASHTVVQYNEDGTPAWEETGPQMTSGGRATEQVLWNVCFAGCMEWISRHSFLHRLGADQGSPFVCGLKL